jgi:hypothetical protein
MVKYLPLSVLLLSMLVGRCAITEQPLDHENPLDRIYESGNFRMVLSAESTSTSSTTLRWGNVYHTSEGELSDSNLKLNTTASVLYKATAPTSTEIASVKAKTALTGYTTVTSCPVAVSSSSYAGTCGLTGSSSKGTFIILFNYKFTDKSGVTTSGILYSNFVEIQ